MAQNIITNLEFANEVRADRLKLLWRVTTVAALVIGWIALNLAMLQRQDVLTLAIPVFILVGGCLITRTLLNRGSYETAARVYTLVVGLGLACILYFSDAESVRIVPFVFPVMIFIVGLLLPPSITFIAALIAAAITVFVPAAALGGYTFFGVYQIAAMTFTLVAALLAMQVTGDLYQVTDWALQNYQRERRVATELFDSRQLLERSLARSQALGERLQQTNLELNAARASAEEAKHFRGQFLANMSHELRTPLNAIIGFSETMLRYPVMYDGVELPTAYEADLGQIYTSGRQLLNLINDILDLSKVDAGKLDIRMDRFNLKPVIEAAIATASGLIAQKPIRLETDLRVEIPDVYADEARVRQVLLNVYSNAAKFTEKGTITLWMREVDEGVQISVRDTGSGIPADSLELIFEEFKQAETGLRDPRAGAGLGLAISRQLLSLMGGRMWAESELGRGSVFHFILQRYPESMESETMPTGNTAKFPFVGSLESDSSGVIRFTPVNEASVPDAMKESIGK